MARRPIQLKEPVKEDFDAVHKILGFETQSETVAHLIKFYRENGTKVQV